MMLRNNIKESETGRVQLSSGETFEITHGRPSKKDHAVGTNIDQDIHATPPHVVCNHIALLGEIITQEPDITKVNAFISAIKSVVEETVPRTTPPGAEEGGKLIVEVELGESKTTNTSKKRLLLNYFPPSLLALPLREMYDGLKAVQRPDVKLQSRIRVAFNIWGYTGPWH